VASKSDTPAPRAASPRASGAAAGGSPEQIPGVAALILARDHATRIAATVRAARALPGVDLVLVVDDGSTDNTQDLARKAGAVVVRHPYRRGRTTCVETGAAVIAMRDADDAPPRSVLLLDGGLGHYAVGAAPLVLAVSERVADLAVALVDNATPTPGMAATAARRAIQHAAQWKPVQPLSRIRCLTREALEAAMPLARGAGLDPAMTLDVLAAGLTVTEVECEIRHKAQAPASRALRQASQYRDVMMALSSRRIRGGIESTQAAVGDTLHAATRVARPRHGQGDAVAGDER